LGTDLSVLWVASSSSSPSALPPPPTNPSLDFGSLPIAGTVTLAGVLMVVFLQNVNESFGLYDSPINLHFLDLRLLAYNLQSRQTFIPHSNFFERLNILELLFTRDLALFSPFQVIRIFAIFTQVILDM
jgi:hypothetical protein